MTAARADAAENGASPVHEFSRADARRIAVRAQLLTGERPTDLLDSVRHLTMLQADPTTAVAPSAEVVTWSRLGPAYRRGAVDDAVADGSLIELEGVLRPAEDIALHRAEMAAFAGTEPVSEWRQAQRDWVSANDGARRDILARLYDHGPLPSRELPDTTELPWRSSGWNNQRNLRMLLELMVRRGEIAAAGRDGRHRLYDLAERVYPDDPVVPLEEARRLRNARRLRALGIARPRGSECMVDANYVGGAGEEAVVDGVRGRWRVDPEALDATFEGRVAVISPLDRLVYDRARMVELFGFDYQLEMYKPKAKRRWGYWAMPILIGDRLVGKVDATADRTAGVLRVDAVHRDEPFGPAGREGVWDELDSLAAGLGLALDRAIA